MKRLFLLLVASVLAGQALFAAPESQVFRVNTADELLNAIGSDRDIYLDAEYYDLTAALQARPDLFLEDDDLAGPDKHVYYVEQFDGPELHVNNVHNLNIYVGEVEGGASTVLIDPRYAFVMLFEMSKDITLSGITFGHTEEGYCDRGVLCFAACEGVRVQNCDLFGCGTEGIVVESCTDFLFENSKIRDCSYHTMHIIDSTSVYFINSQFFRNREFNQICIIDSEDVYFFNCMIANNQGPLFYVDCPVTFNNCVFLHEGDWGEGTENITAINCIAEEPYIAVG